jgi:predicted RNA methylase
VRIRRTIARPEVSAIDAAAAPPGPLPLRLHCRAGLEPLLAEELAALGLAGATLCRPLQALFASRLWTAIGFPLPPAANPAAAITSPASLAVLRAFTRGAPRYRIAFAGGGHRRAEVRAIAREVARRAPDLINDPTRTDWEARVDEHGGVELRPRGLADPRFAYRVADVPAASHPTLAAALARVAFVHASDPAADVIWDPFCGSALELIERARLGAAARLLGSDRDPAALAAARANLSAAGVAAELSAADALACDPGGVTTIVTNPPMGRRVARGESLDLLDRFVARAGALLAPGGRLVWIAPSPRRTDPVAAAAQLDIRSRYPIDMGGFAAELQLWIRV